LVLLSTNAFKLFNIPIYRLHVPYEVYSINASWTFNLISSWDEHDFIEEEFEDTNGVIRIRKSKENRQHNGQKNKYKGQTTIYKTFILNKFSSNTKPDPLKTVSLWPYYSWFYTYLWYMLLPSMIVVSRTRMRENGYSLQSYVILRIAPSTRIKLLLVFITLVFCHKYL
jgi:hypothetical protein